MKIFITGGAGYIGSHAALELLQANHSIVVLDNLSNSSTVALDRVAHITGKRPILVEGDIREWTLKINGGADTARSGRL